MGVESVDENVLKDANRFTVHKDEQLEKIKELESKRESPVVSIKKKVLIVVKDLEEIEAYAKTLAVLSFNTLCCKSSEEALKIIFQN